MRFSLRRLRAIAIKEWKDAIRNPQILLTAAMPIAFSFLFDRKEASDPAVVAFPLLLAVSITGAFVQANMVAEEKEKNTLRMLMLSPASPAEVLLGKSVATSALALLVMIGSLAVTSVPDANPIGLTALILLLLIAFLAFGTTIGLLSRTVTDISIVGLPLLLVVIMGPMLGTSLDMGWFSAVVDWLPTQHFVLGLTGLLDSGSLAGIGVHLAALAFWCAAACLLCLGVYSRKRYDK
ncbi:ABC transporter permease [Cohnella thailandensis]|uniref:ABC transporter permease n=1 Tax=Cohnella thailandensis TaxID=557557 RepID=A0A841SZX5_9BACL|nr:ABC transporter permease [Cohnella thailandensis]MBB6637454.1 ABC transporter permease [Cohnella thailandensis]MBP1977831.1 ABC-2 type transport system permease protein [Cohnella thailandensis]